MDTNSWSYIQNDDNWRLWIWKINSLLNLIKIQHGYDYIIIDNGYLYVKNPNEVNYQYLINKPEKKAFIEYYFKVRRNVRQNSTCYFIMKIPNKREHNKLHSVIYIDFQYFISHYQNYTTKPLSD